MKPRMLLLLLPLLGCGSVVLGSSETAGRMYAEIDAQMQLGTALDAAA